MQANNPTQPRLRQVPRHIAIIMDGNGRWAQRRGMERSAGHVAGVKTVRRITEAASRLGVGYLTLYAFSTENWNRPQAEVDMLMHLMVSVIEDETPHLIENNVRLSIIGDMDRLDPEARRRVMACVARTEHCTGLNLVLCISYSARWELTRAAKRIAAEVASGTLSPDDIDDRAISYRLATAGMPDPDLLIRTGGEMRLSNFLLWQMAYGEIVVTDTFWPDFDRRHLEAAIDEFNGRQRRYGMTGEQVTQAPDATQP